jgi:hypothetical protein
MEIWKDIKGYKGYYQVSNLGQIKSLERIVRTKDNKMVFFPETILKPNKINSGYCQVQLSKDCRSSFLVHRLVAQAFLSNPHRYQNVNHKDGNKANNCVDNLEYCTQKYNLWHSVNILGNDLKNNNKDKVWGNNYNSVAVYQYTLDGLFVCGYSSTTEAQAKTGIHRDGIYKVIKGKRVNAGGFIWSYEKKDSISVDGPRLSVKKYVPVKRKKKVKVEVKKVELPVFSDSLMQAMSMLGRNRVY